MPARRPLVLIDGRLQQLPAGDSIDAPSSEVDIIVLTNGGGVSAPIGSPVYISAAATFQLSRANALGTVEVIGLVRDPAIAAAGVGNVQTDGGLVATTAQWDVVTGQIGGLTPGGIYYLSSATAGRLTTTAPSTSGEFVLRVGQAVSTTSLEISPRPSIQL